MEALPRDSTSTQSTNTEQKSITQTIKSKLASVVGHKFTKASEKPEDLSYILYIPGDDVRSVHPMTDHTVQPKDSTVLSRIRGGIQVAYNETVGRISFSSTPSNESSKSAKVEAKIEQRKEKFKAACNACRESINTLHDIKNNQLNVAPEEYVQLITTAKQNLKKVKSAHKSLSDILKKNPTYGPAPEPFSDKRTLQLAISRAKANVKPILVKSKLKDMGIQ